MIEVFSNANTSSAADMELQGLSVVNQVTGAQGGSGYTLAVNTWYRIEQSASINGSTVSGSVQIYTGDSTTSVFDSGGYLNPWIDMIDYVQFGVRPSNGNITTAFTFWMDDIAIRTTGAGNWVSAPQALPTSTTTRRVGKYVY
jgi:hypothetical protein